MKNLGRLFAIASLLAFGLPAFAGPAAPQAAGARIGIVYNLTFWGISFGQTSFDMRFQKDAYETSSDFHTSGLVSAFWQANIQATSTGRHDDHDFQPLVYDSFYSRGEDKKERVKLTYASEIPTLFADPPYKVNKYPVSDEQKKDSLDPMSAVAFILTGAQADAKNPCGKVAPVFDGRRRYNIAFTYLKDEPAKVEGIYDGTAHLCQMHYNQIAGFKPKIMKEGAAFPPIYGWFIDVPDAGAPNGHFVVALKVWADTGWGTVVAQLSRLTVEGAKPQLHGSGSPT